MDAFAWGVIGSVAGVVAAAAAIVFGIIPLLQNHRKAGLGNAESAKVQVRDDQSGQLGSVIQRVSEDIQICVESQAPPVAQSPRPVIVGEIPQASPAFQPRRDLASALAASGPGTVLVYALTGMRGVGKTQIAADYARSRIDEKWRLVAWVNAADPVGVLNGLSQTAAQFSLIDPGGSLESTGEAVRHWLEADGERCLVVFDNVTDIDHLARYLPVAGHSQVIVTSNNVEAELFGSAVPVDVFTEEDGLKFLARRTGLADEQGASDLGCELGWLPLALAQAGAVIAAQHLDYPAYLERLRAHSAQKYLSRVKGDTYPFGTSEAITLALDAVADSDPAGLSGPLMDMVSLMSEVGVRRDLLRTAGQAGLRTGSDELREVTAEDIDAALGRLAGASLLTFTVDRSAVIAHRLIMRVVLERRVATGELAKTGAAVADMLLTATGSFVEPWRNRTAARDTIEQIAALHHRLIPYLGRNDAALAEKLLELRLRAIACLNSLGDSFTQVIEQGPVLVADSEQMLGRDDLTTLTARAHLAYASRAAGLLSEAIQMYEGILADCERLLGESHQDTMTARNNLAYAYQQAGRLVQAIPLFERTLADCERVLGESHPATLGSRNNLAGAYDEIGRLGDAIPLYERNLTDRERLLGESHPATLGSRNNLAYAYQQTGRVGEAIPLFERTVTDYVQVLGESHPHTLTSRNNLAAAYRAAGRIGEAISLYEQNLADRERALGQSHPDTLRSRNNLATAYQAVGRAADAQALLGEVASP